MGRSTALFALAIFVQSVALSAAAATIEPGEFANGTNISTQIRAVTLSEGAAPRDIDMPLIMVPLH